MKEVDYQSAGGTDNHPDGLRLYTIFDNHVPAAHYSKTDLEALGEAMDRASAGGVSTLAGYTYLGQFLAHDISRQRMKHGAVVELIKYDKLNQNDVSPILDLSNVYQGAIAESPLRSGPYMALGSAVRADGTELPGYDLARDGFTAYLGDDRDDENLIVSQLHVQFLRLHNFFVDRIGAEQPSLDIEALFKAAKKQVILHYQEVILYDFLYEILHPDVWRAIILQNKSILWEPSPTEEPVLPIEFAAAVGRIGHSMVRNDYNLNKVTDILAEELLTMTGPGRFNTKYSRLPSRYLIYWLNFFDFPGLDRSRSNVNKSKRISPKVRVKLSNMDGLDMPELTNLAARNLIRSNNMYVCCGQDAVNYINTRFSAQLENCGINLRLLTHDELNLNSEANRQDLLHGINEVICEKTPLWFYTLAEACVTKSDGIGKLGVLGSLIYAESIKGLLKLDKNSILNTSERRDDIAPTKKIGMAPDRKFLQMSDLILAVNPGLPDLSVL